MSVNPELLKLVQEYAAGILLPDDINDQTRIYHDLGLFGDEAWGFLKDYTKLGAPLVDFKFEEYFPPESFGKTALLSFVFLFVPRAILLRKKTLQGVEGCAFKQCSFEWAVGSGQNLLTN